MTTLENLLSAFGIRGSHYRNGVMSSEQVLGYAVTDHRGRIEMPAYAVMVESATSGGFWYSLNEPVGTVQSWLSLTAAAPADVNQRLFATSQLVYTDGVYGALTVQIANDSQDVVCAGVGRCVRVSRTSDALANIKTATAPQADELIPFGGEPTSLPSAIDSELDGRQILSAISQGRIASGPLCELLCATATLADTGVRLIVSPQPWMANPLGAIQGGVVAAIISQACSFAGQLYAEPGQQYALVDFTASFWRSPQVDVGEITVTAVLEKLGRRIGTVSATMTGPDDVPLARAVADIQYG
ncbi:MAG: PaaI family thioesterase [Mycobacterium sp.]|nr:PaaI family thioesterase [Mycobacterium sp.]